MIPMPMGFGTLHAHTPSYWRGDSRMDSGGLIRRDLPVHLPGSQSLPSVYPVVEERSNDTTGEPREREPRHPGRDASTGGGTGLAPLQGAEGDGDR